jgi:UDP-glucose:(glucosyl)LPS alpha-1,3-glucosyltransferase
VTRSSSRARLALATITDDAYLPGTIVLLSSFLRHNPWFDGDIVVMHERIPAGVRARLAGFPNVRFHAIGPELGRRLDAVVAAFPESARKRAIFYSLEALNLREYEQVLKLDTDIMCTGDARPLFASPAPLACCLDQSYFLDQVRDRHTYGPRARRDGTSPDAIMPATFNAGMMRIGRPLLTGATYEHLLALVQPGTWMTVRSGHTDSVVLNRYFEGLWTRAGERYNFLVSRRMERAVRPRIPIDEAVFVHFVGRHKPWTHPHPFVMSDARRAAFERWDEAARIAEQDGPVHSTEK